MGSHGTNSTLRTHTCVCGIVLREEGIGEAESLKPIQFVPVPYFSLNVSSLRRMIEGRKEVRKSWLVH